MDNKTGLDNQPIDVTGWFKEQPLESLYEVAVTHGIDVTSGQTKEAINRRREDAAAQVRAAQDIKPRSLTLFRASIPLPGVSLDNIVQSVDHLMHSIGSVLLAAVVAAFTKIGLPLSILALWFAEFVSSWAGFAVFDTLTTQALVESSVQTEVQALLHSIPIVLAFVSVTGYFVLSFQLAQSYYADSKALNRVRWSLRVWRDNIQYQTGYGKAWQPQTVDHVRDLQGKARLLSVVIVLIGTVGRIGMITLTSEVRDLNAAYFGGQTLMWYVSIVANMLFSAVLLAVAQATIYFNAQKYYEADGERRERLKSAVVWTPAEQERADHAVRLYLMSRLLDTGWTPPVAALPEQTTIQEEPIPITLPMSVKSSNGSSYS